MVTGQSRSFYLGPHRPGLVDICIALTWSTGPPFSICLAHLPVLPTPQIRDDSMTPTAEHLSDGGKIGAMQGARPVDIDASLGSHNSRSDYSYHLAVASFDSSNLYPSLAYNINHGSRWTANTASYPLYSGQEPCGNEFYGIDECSSHTGTSLVSRKQVSQLFACVRPLRRMPTVQ